MQQYSLESIIVNIIFLAPIITIITLVFAIGIYTTVHWIKLYTHKRKNIPPQDVKAYQAGYAAGLKAQQEQKSQKRKTPPPPPPPIIINEDGTYP